MKLEIYFNDVFVGELFYSGEFSIKYSKEWLENGFFLSPHLKNPTHKNIEIFLQNLLPEGENLETISLFKQISKYNTFKLIEEIGSDITGAISFRKPYQKIDTKFIPLNMEELLDKLNSNSNIAIWDKTIRLSIAGVNKKLPIMIKNKQFGFGDGEYASTHIFKFDKNNLNLVENEFLSLKLAKKVLKKFLKETRRSGEDSHDKGGGLGFIEIAKKSTGKLEYSITKIDENKSYFEISVNI